MKRRKRRPELDEFFICGRKVILRGGRLQMLPDLFMLRIISRDASLILTRVRVIRRLIVARVVAYSLQSVQGRLFFFYPVH